MSSRRFLASVLALAAVSTHAAPMGMAVPIISSKSAHISIVVYKATCRMTPNASDPTCQAAVSVGQSARMPVFVTLMQGPFPQTNVQALMLQAVSGGPVVGFMGMDKGRNGTYTGQGHVELPGVNTTEDMTCTESQPKQGHL